MVSETGAPAALTDAEPFGADDANDPREPAAPPPLSGGLGRRSIRGNWQDEDNDGALSTARQTDETRHQLTPMLFEDRSACLDAHVAKASSSVVPLGTSPRSRSQLRSDGRASQAS